MFHESYGEVTRKQLATYRKYNVSPHDHAMLEQVFGDDVDGIIQEVVALSPNGYYQPRF